MKYIPYNKMSKKDKKKIDNKKRGSWHGVNPVTKTTTSKKEDNRKKELKRALEESE